MKVLVLNGSPHKNGCTAAALDEVIRTLNKEGIETELLQVGCREIRGCTACGYCERGKGCVVDDLVNDAAVKLEGVESTKYYKETVDKLTKVTSFMSVTSVIIMIFLILVSVVVVSNTIKLTVMNRAKEISIMKYVGATNWFIRGPFLVEGIILGAIASAVSAGIVYLAYSRVVEAIGEKVMTIISSPLVPAGYLFTNLVIIFLAIGVGIGATGSIISMRKFLDT